jgi:gamma-glutamylcyclotransferase
LDWTAKLGNVQGFSPAKPFTQKFFRAASTEGSSRLTGIFEIDLLPVNCISHVPAIILVLPSISMSLPAPPRLYFAYGSSLSLSEMQSHCPTSTFHSIAVLRNHRWLVNERGYANIVPSFPAPNSAEDVVWGILYTLRAFDEELLDKQEGIPWAYSKEDMDVEAISITEDGRGTRREVVMALVYIDRERIQESYPWPEFAVKMNRGIQEALEKGVPRTWIDKVVRSYIPETIPENGPEVSNGGAAQQNGAVPPSPRAASDHASQTQGSVNGSIRTAAILKEKPYRSSKPHGLEQSKHAQESKTSGASRRRACRERDGIVTQQSHENRGPPPERNKLLECWWWRVKGSCRFSDDACHYAHHQTGAVANPPGTKQTKAGDFGNRKELPPQQIPRKQKAVTSEPEPQKENSHPYGFPQNWSSGQPSKAVNDTSQSWSEQVENLMDAPSDWLGGSDRTDVKW